MRKSEQLITSCLSEHTPKEKLPLFKVRKANAITSCHFWHFMKCNMVWDCFRMYCVTFETYFTVDCTQLIVKRQNTRFSTFLMILLIKLLWNMFKRV